MKDADIQRARNVALNYIRSISGHKQDAEDFAQDAIVKILEMETAGTLYYDNIDALALRIAKHLFIDKKREENYKHRPKIFSIFDCPCIINIEDEPYNEDIDIQYEEYIGILKERDQKVVKMRLSGISHKEISNTLGIRIARSNAIFTASLKLIRQYIENKKQ